MKTVVTVELEYRTLVRSFSFDNAECARRFAKRQMRPWTTVQIETVR